MNQGERMIIDEGIQEYLEENKEREDRERLKSEEKAFAEYTDWDIQREKEKTERIEVFARNYLNNYLKEHPEGICTRCHGRCRLIDDFSYECVLIGVKIVEKDRNGNKLEIIKF